MCSSSHTTNILRAQVPRGLRGLSATMRPDRRSEAIPALRGGTEGTAAGRRSTRARPRDQTTSRRASRQCRRSQERVHTTLAIHERSATVRARSSGCHGHLSGANASDEHENPPGRPMLIFRPTQLINVPHHRGPSSSPSLPRLHRWSNGQSSTSSTSRRRPPCLGVVPGGRALTLCRGLGHGLAPRASRRASGRTGRHQTRLLHRGYHSMASAFADIPVVKPPPGWGRKRDGLASLHRLLPVPRLAGSHLFEKPRANSANA